LNQLRESPPLPEFQSSVRSKSVDKTSLIWWIRAPSYSPTNL